MKKKMNMSFAEFKRRLIERSEHLATIRSFRKSHKMLMAEEHEKNTEEDKKEAPEEEA